MSPAVGHTLRKPGRAWRPEPGTAIEIEFSLAGDPLWYVPYLDGLSFDYVSIHSLELLVADPEPPVPAHLDALAAVARASGARAVSDHLVFSHGGEIGGGRATSTRFTPAALDTVCRNIDVIQQRLGDVAFFLENLAHFYRPHGTMAEAEFLRRVLERTGCGWLLDITTVYHNALNFGGDARTFLHEVMPATGRVQIHLSGSYRDERSGKHIACDDEPVPGAVWDLYREALELGRGEVEAVFLERDGNDSPGDLRRARRIAEEVELVAGVA
jgi:uncharacterized protein (UPF0276 family)